MSFKRNDIVSKQRLRDALEEETAMGFAHNDIVTTYAMDKAIAEGGGGGGGDYTTCTMTVADTYHGEMQYAYGAFLVNDELVSDVELIDAYAYQTILYKGKQTIVVVTSGTVTVSGDATQGEDGKVTATGDFTVTIS